MKVNKNLLLIDKLAVDAMRSKTRKRNAYYIMYAGKVRRKRVRIVPAWRSAALLWRTPVRKGKKRWRTKGFLNFFVDKILKMRIIGFCMDTQNDIRMACGEVAKEFAGFSVVVGAKQLRKSLHSGRAQKVFLAQNADPAITEPLAQLCRHNKVPFAWISSMNELGQACGIEVGAAAAAAIK